MLRPTRSFLRWLEGVVLCSALLTAGSVRADPPPGDGDEGEDLTGVEVPARESGDVGRDIVSAFLWLPRNAIDLLFTGMTTAAALVQNNQLVPRYSELLGGTPGTDIFVFPTVFAETGSGFSVGLRALMDSDDLATSARVGYGGSNDIVLEGRVQVKGTRKLPFLLSLEGLYELQSDLEYFGVGQAPDRDARNAFRPGSPYRVGRFLQRKVRLISSLGLRFAESFELYLSTSLARRQIRDTPGAGPEALSHVFLRGTPGPGEGDVSIADDANDTWITYSEVAIRLDSRKSIGGPSPGVLVETYLGGGQSFQGDDVVYMRVGARGAAFIPLYRSTNIVSPRLVIDRLVPLGGVAVPFYELSRQPDFRGFDTHRDNLSLVVSLDYSWQLVPFMGMRLFADMAAVAPSFAGLTLDVLEEARFAVGWGMDLYTSTSALGGLAISASPEGARVLINLGVPVRYGDRQHRD